jgi:ATP/maltotriose-dependent transcriptional regulator MalT
MRERQRARKQIVPAQHKMSLNEADHQIVGARRGDRTLRVITHEDGHQQGVGDSVMLAILVPMHTAQDEQEHNLTTSEHTSSQFDWDHSVYALVDADSPAAERLRQIVAIQHQDEATVGEGCSRDDAEELIVAARLDRLADAPERVPSVAPLSRRERDVLRLLAQGQSNQDIAQTLTVAVSTVKMHIKHIYRKLGVNNRVQAIARAWSLHML